MVKLISLRNYILQKLALVVIIVIFSLINVYIKGKWVTNDTESGPTERGGKDNGRRIEFPSNGNKMGQQGNHPDAGIGGDDLRTILTTTINENSNLLLPSTASQSIGDIRRKILALNGDKSSSSSADPNGEIKVNETETTVSTVKPPSKPRKNRIRNKPSTTGTNSVEPNASKTNSTTNGSNSTAPVQPSTVKSETKGSGKNETRAGRKENRKNSKTSKTRKEENGNSTKPGSPTEAPSSLTTVRSHPGPPKTMIPLIKNVKIKECTAPAYKEFPDDIFGNKIRRRGAVIVHIAVACYMFYCLAIVCDHYFLTSLEECSTRLGLSNDVAGATLMAAGSSAPELFTAVLGVFVAKGDVGTGTIVGSAVFNILFVIGLCGVFTAPTVLTWWPVARDSTYYTLTVLVLILVAYDGEVTIFESSLMLLFYVGYIVVMHFNLQLRELVTAKLKEKGLLDSLPEGSVDCGMGGEIDEISTKHNSVAYYQSMQVDEWGYNNQQPQSSSMANNYNTYNHHNQYSSGYPGYSGLPPSMDPNKISLYEAAQLVIVKHKRLFPAITRFRAAANYTIAVNGKQTGNGNSKSQKQRQHQFNYKNGEGSSFIGTSKISARERMTSNPSEEDWSLVPNPVTEGWLPVVKWCIIAPLHATLFYTIPNCKTRSNLFLVTFLMSVFWIAVFSYIMVWMVTLVGFTFGIPDSIMGITFLAAGTSIPDAYTSIHVARQGQGDMAVSNSIGSNVFDILVGLALPWFIETTLWQPGTTASINSRGLFYAIILLFLSLLVTIYLFHHMRWTLNPKLGYALLITYAVFLVFCGALELNLLGYVNPVMCDE